MTLAAVLTHAFRPDYLPEMLRKVYQRARYGTREMSSGREWAQSRAVDLDDWATTRNPAAWAESVRVCDALRAEAQPKVAELEALGVRMGGAGSLELLYFLARVLRPQLVLETGVAAGWSTTALLRALQDNGQGHLLSSDFPYFRIPDAERYVGHLVPAVLKGRWTLRTKGDRKNLPELLTPGSTVQLVHYDSDKSRGGRAFFITSLRGHMDESTVLVVDDINDDLFFSELADGRSDVAVFEYGGKYVGLLGLGDAQEPLPPSAVN